MWLKGIIPKSKLKFGELSVVKSAEHERYVSNGSHLKVSTLVVTMAGFVD